MDQAIPATWPNPEFHPVGSMIWLKSAEFLGESKIWAVIGYEVLPPQ
jgi:hypothetical protein